MKESMRDKLHKLAIDRFGSYSKIEICDAFIDAILESIEVELPMKLHAKGCQTKHKVGYKCNCGYLERNLAIDEIKETLEQQGVKVK